MTHLLPEPDSLSLPEQVAQMLVVRASGYLFDHQIQYPSWEPKADVLRHWLTDLGMGGVILLGGSAGEIACRCQQLQEWAAIPLFIAADIEEGVGQRFSGAAWFPPPLALAGMVQSGTAIEQVQQSAQAMGAWTAQEALAIGLNWVLAPVVDVNNNPQNPVINVRAFGETPELVSQLATAFIQGAQPYPVLTTAKHFPGHGDTATDSHLDLPVIPHDLNRIRSLEYPPFQAAIAANVDGVMSAHLLIPALDPEYPATLSPKILTGELRQALGFDGLIVTDALVMGAIANQYGDNEAAVLAVAAGADILMMPADPPGAISAVCAAVEQGRIPLEQIEASVERIWRAKQKITSYEVEDTSYQHAWETHTPLQIDLDRLGTTEAIEATATILQGSKVVQGRITSVPAHARTLIIVDDLLDCEFLSRKAPAIDLPRKLSYQVQIVDGNTPEILLDKEAQPTFLQLFIRGNPFRGSAQLSRKAEAWFEFLLKSGQLQALAVYGSPYALTQFQAQLSAEIPYGFSYGQMPLAQESVLKELFGEIG
ncbi:beta-glucosidase [Acaryochloris sp. 'Moss Beach']|uniref:glycoside hydrolase family 3 N-terminal domain-containing protein n=1 Tax=Acaryochloris sp. 'Moss Beach' TaxID=2740837 RepID=UPI001F1C03C8|nr:glycoside hydrolase family 3 N-terminal domain-containing protein [Acaryochloris sp. 'Moss Beach']UJB71675.1 beta-glucosidase [Acaryochloris sp. 'Moss Beach']